MQDFVGFLVQLDPRLQELITLLITGGVSLALLQLAALYPALAEYLGQYKAGIVTFLTGLVVNLMQNVLNRIPESWDAVVALVMQLIVEVVLVLLAFAFLRKRGVRALRV